MVEYEIDINFNLNNTEQIDDAASKLETLKEEAENTGTSTEDMGNQAQKTSDEVKDMGDSASSSAGQVDVLGDAISGIVSLGLAAEFTNTAMAADKYKVSMAALNQVADNNNVSMSNVSSAIDKVTNSTSIGGGQARSYFSMLMNLGVTNTNALADSMIALKGQSSITGGSMEQMSSKMTSIINMSSLSARSLTGLGISLQQLADTNNMSVEELKSSWSTMTADQKLEALNNAMSKNSDLVTTMNQTTGEKLQEVQNSWAQLEITVGQSTTKSSQFVLDFANGAIKTLNDAVKNIPFADTFAGGLLAVGSFATGAKPAFDTFNSIAKTAKNARDAVKGLKDAMSTGKDIITGFASAAGKIVKPLKDGVLAMAESFAATVTEAGGKAAAVFPTITLAGAEMSLLWPILLVTAAIIAIIAILYYLYNTNEVVRNAIDGFINTLKNVAAVIIGVVKQAIQTAINKFNEVKNTVSNVGAAIKSKWDSAMNSVKSAIDKVIGPIDNFISKAKEALGIDFSSISFSGTSYAGVGFEGFDSTLNHTLSNDLSNNNRQGAGNTNVFNINGIIEETASEYIVKSVNDHLRRENLKRGV